MAEPVVLTGTDKRGVATVMLNRPAVNNAFFRLSSRPETSWNAPHKRTREDGP